MLIRWKLHKNQYWGVT